MARSTFLSSGATISKQAPRFGQKSCSKPAVITCITTLTTSDGERILPLILALVLGQRCKMPTISLVALSNERRIGTGLQMHIWHKCCGGAATMLDVPRQLPPSAVGPTREWRVTFKSADMLELEIVTCVLTMMGRMSGGWMQWWKTNRVGAVMNVHLKDVTIIDWINKLVNSFGGLHLLVDQ